MPKLLVLAAIASVNIVASQQTAAECRESIESMRAYYVAQGTPDSECVMEANQMVAAKAIMEANYARLSGRPCTLDYSAFETVSTCDEKLVAHESYCASIAACLAPAPSPPPATPPTPPDVGINAGRGAPAVAPSADPSNDFFDDECGGGWCISTIEGGTHPECVGGSCCPTFMREMCNGKCIGSGETCCSGNQICLFGERCLDDGTCIENDCEAILKYDHGATGEVVTPPDAPSRSGCISEVKEQDGMQCVRGKSTTKNQVASSVCKTGGYSDLIFSNDMSECDFTNRDGSSSLGQCARQHLSAEGAAAAGDAGGSASDSAGDASGSASDAPKTGITLTNAEEPRAAVDDFFDTMCGVGLPDGGKSYCIAAINGGTHPVCTRGSPTNDQADERCCPSGSRSALDYTTGQCVENNCEAILKYEHDATGDVVTPDVPSCMQRSGCISEVKEQGGMQCVMSKSTSWSQVASSVCTTGGYENQCLGDDESMCDFTNMDGSSTLGECEAQYLSAEGAAAAGALVGGVLIAVIVVPILAVLLCIGSWTFVIIWCCCCKGKKKPPGAADPSGVEVKTGV